MIAVATEASAPASADLASEFRRAQGLALPVMADVPAQDDLRLAGDMIAEIRKMVVVVTDLRQRIANLALGDDPIGALNWAAPAAFRAVFS